MKNSKGKFAVLPIANSVMVKVSKTNSKTKYLILINHHEIKLFHSPITRTV